MKTLLIVNPISGTSNKTDIVDHLLRRLSALGVQADVRYTTCRGNATQLAQRAIEKEYEAVVTVGGDGTINETAAALSGSSVTLGIIPAGSGNGLARHLGIPVDVDGAIDVIMQNHRVTIDYGTMNGLPFFCTFGIGFDAAVSHRFARQRRRGPLSYIKSAIDEFVQFHPSTYTISANGKVLTEKAFLVACCNTSQYGNNAYIAPEASITDGLLDFTIVHAGNPISTALVGVDLFTGFINRNTLIQTFKAPSAVIYSSCPSEAHIDGEPIVAAEAMEVKCHRCQLRVFTPAQTETFRPLLTPMNNLVRDTGIAIRNAFKIKKS